MSEEDDLRQRVAELESINRSQALQLATSGEGRALMWVTLANIREGAVRAKDLRSTIERVIGTGDDPQDGTPERFSIEQRREMAVRLSAYRDAAYRATRDADLMALIVGILDLGDGRITNTADGVIPHEAWVEIQEAVQRSRERTDVPSPPVA